MNINLPITGAREPPIPSSMTGTRFPVFGYCAIVVRPRKPKPITLLSISDLEIGIKPAVAAGPQRVFLSGANETDRERRLSRRPWR